MAAGRVRKSIYKRRRWVLSSVSAYIVPAPRRAHPHLERAERVLDRLAALTHGLRILVETPLHRLQYMLVLQRVMRRSLPVVQRCLIAQVPHALVQ